MDAEEDTKASGSGEKHISQLGSKLLHFGSERVGECKSTMDLSLDPASRNEG
jgi:hypothetical protein